MRQVVIGRGPTGFDAEQDAKAQAQVIAGGRYTTISMTTDYMPATSSFQARLVIEF